MYAQGDDRHEVRSRGPVPPDRGHVDTSVSMRSKPVVCA
eukprot:XP_001704371.1 Hypothetical protein GL50803_38271 [Giardia lamblia ATCC 50803]